MAESHSTYSKHEIFFFYTASSACLWPKMKQFETGCTTESWFKHVIIMMNRQSRFIPGSSGLNCACLHVCVRRMCSLSVFTVTAATYEWHLFAYSSPQPAPRLYSLHTQIGLRWMLDSTRTICSAPLWASHACCTTGTKTSLADSLCVCVWQRSEDSEASHRV